MDVLQIPVVALYSGMIISFTIVMLFVTVGDVVKS